MRRAFAALALACLAAPAAGEEADYVPAFGALSGATLTHSVSRSFDSYEMPVGPFSREARPARRLEGTVRELVYRLDDETSTLEAIRNYERRLRELGYEVIFECEEAECGGFDFRFGVYLVDPPAMRFDLADFGYLAAADEATMNFATVIASRQGGKLFVQVIDVAAESAPLSMSPLEDAPRPRAKPDDARLYALARRLTERGYAPLEGIAFEAGSARLTVESDAALAQAAQLLVGRPDLTFLVVGHTDNDGDLALNMKLSLARAQAVAARLAQMSGVDPTRLEAHGVGYLSPRAANTDAAGRALNRRVELVIK